MTEIGLRAPEIAPEDDPSRRSDRPAPLRRVTHVLLAGALATLFLMALVLLVEIATNRPFQVDEVEHVHAAFETRVGRLIYRDFRQTHDPLLYPLLALVIDPAHPVASFHRSRAVSTTFLIAIILLTAYCAGRLSNALGGLLALGLALTHTTLIERGMEVRPDVPAALCIVAALAVELSGIERRRRFVLEGLILSLSFLFINKAAFACFAFGCLWLASAIRRRSPGLVLWPMAAWTLPVAAAFGLMAWLGSLEGFLRINVVSAVSEALGEVPFKASFGPWPFLAREGSRNVVFSALAVVGLAYGVASWWPRSRFADGRLRFTGFLGVVLVASLWLNPYPFPYLHVTVLPTLAVLAAVAVARLAAARGLTAAGPAGIGLVAALVAVSLLLAAPRLVEVATRSQQEQLATLKTIQRVTGPDDPVFDMAGFYFRPDGQYAYAMAGAIFARYRAGGLAPIPEELRRTGTVAVIFNYRTTWLGPKDRRFLSEHYVQYDRNIFLLGIALSKLGPGDGTRFEALVGKRFRFDGRGRIAVDGKPFEEGFLARGWHTVERIEGDGPARLIMETPGRAPWPPRPPRQLFVNFD